MPDISAENIEKYKFMTLQQELERLHREHKDLPRKLAAAEAQVLKLKERGPEVKVRAAEIDVQLGQFRDMPSGPVLLSKVKTQASSWWSDDERDADRQKVVDAVNADVEYFKG